MYLIFAQLKHQKLIGTLTYSHNVEEWFDTSLKSDMRHHPSFSEEKIKERLNRSVHLKLGDSHGSAISCQFPPDSI